MRKLALLMVVLGLIQITPAFAHSLKLFAVQSGDIISGKAYFAGGAAAQDIPGSMTSSNDVLDFRTDAEGRFSLPAPANGSILLVVDAGDGHLAQTTLDVLARNAVTTATDPAIAQQIIALRQDMAELKDRLFLADIIGGLGILMGLFGAFAWFKTRA